MTYSYLDPNKLSVFSIFLISGPTDFRIATSTKEMETSYLNNIKFNFEKYVRQYVNQIWLNCECPKSKTVAPVQGAYSK